MVGPPFAVADEEVRLLLGARWSVQVVEEQDVLGESWRFVQANAIEHIAIKKRSKKGEFAGGPTTFKIEGVFQLLEDVEVTLLSPQTINAQNKKHTFELPASLNKYQHEAYKAACSALLKK